MGVAYIVIVQIPTISSSESYFVTFACYPNAMRGIASVSAARRDRRIPESMAVLFVATPDRVQELFRNSRLTSGGLLPRFLSCDPGAKPVAIDPNASEINYSLPTDVSQPYEAAIFAAVHCYRISGADEPHEITMTDAARRVLAEDWNRFCAANNGTRDQPFEARHTENAIRIALVLDTFGHVDIQHEGRGTFHAINAGL